MEDVENNPIPLRKSHRQQKLSERAKEYRDSLKSNIVVVSDDSDYEASEQVEKPTILHSNEAVLGSKIFTFQTRKRRDAILQKASQSNQDTHKNIMKKRIAAKVTEQDSLSDLDYSDSGSEYVASEESESEHTNQSSESDSDTPVLKTRATPKVQSLMENSRKTPKSRKGYAIKADDYFVNHSSRKIVTSNHCLDKLETPRLPQNDLHKLLAKVKLSEGHDAAIQELHKTNLYCFNRWIYLLHEGFNILLYGLGSKKKVLDEFHRIKLKKLPVIVVNGFFPSLTVKDVLNGILVDLLELKECPANLYEACDLIAEQFSCIPSTHLYVLIHNIELIRGGKSQGVFARLAAIRNIHLVASIDHINAPLIWDHSKLGKFNFTWWDVTTFGSYIDETSFESSMMVQRTGNLALSSLRNVFLSLTSNSKGIYFKLVKDQLNNAKNRYYQGLSFKDLYLMCREAFLVSSDLALRTQLTEFVDHKMVKIKRSVEGTEYLTVPIANTVLQQFLNEQDA